MERGRGAERDNTPEVKLWWVSGLRTQHRLLLSVAALVGFDDSAGQAPNHGREKAAA